MQQSETFFVTCAYTILYKPNQNIMTTTTTRPLYEIASEIRKDWKPVHPYAVPYVNAMSTIDSINDNYLFETAKEQVVRFLCNAGTWRGETAKRVKLELKKMAGLK